MTKIIIRWFLLAVLVTCGPAQAQSTRDAYIGLKKSQFKKTYKHLAVLPLVSAPALSMPDEFKPVITDEVLKKLTKAKLQLVTPEQVQAIRDEFNALYTPEQQKENRAVIGDHTVREVFFRYPVDGTVSIQVLPVAAPFAKDRAEWGGTSQKIKHKGDGLLGAIMGKNYGGNVAASAVRILISDRQGKPVYSWIGGIEVLMHRDGEDLQLLPAEELWQNPKRVVKAAKYAVKPL